MTDSRIDRAIDRRTAIRMGVALAGLATAGVSQSQPAAAAIGVVQELRGTVDAERDGKRIPLALKGNVMPGDTLITGDNALVVLQLGPSTTIKLGAQARLKIERYLAEVGGTFDLQAGPMFFERRGAKPASEGITFRNAYGLIAVRGTRFYAGPNRGAFAVLVGEGRVEVTAGGRTVMVRPQEGIDIKAPGQPPTAPAPWRLPRIREMQGYFR